MTFVDRFTLCSDHFFDKHVFNFARPVSSDEMDLRINDYMVVTRGLQVMKAWQEIEQKKQKQQSKPADK